MADRHTNGGDEVVAGTNFTKKGRVRSFWISMLLEFSKSSLNVRDFCRLKNISKSNFYSWRKRIREEESNTSCAPSFIPVEVVAADISTDFLKAAGQNNQVFFSSDLEKQGISSGLSLQMNSRLKISIDKEFDEPTLQRLVQLFCQARA